MIERRFCMITDCCPLNLSSRLASVETTAWPDVTTCSITVRDPRNWRVFSGSASPLDSWTDMLPSFGSTKTTNPREAFIKVMTRSITLRRTTFSSSEELRSRASSYSRWSRMPRSTSRVKGTTSITMEVAFSLSPKGRGVGGEGRGYRSRIASTGPWVNSIPRGFRVLPGQNRRLARAPESAPARSRDPRRRAASHLCGCGQRQDPRPDRSHRVLDRVASRLARPPSGRHIHQQGGEGDAWPGRDARGRTRAEDVGRDLPLHGGQDPAPRSAAHRHRAELRHLRRRRHAGGAETRARGAPPRLQALPDRGVEPRHLAGQERTEAA